MLEKRSLTGGRRPAVRLPRCIGRLRKATKPGALTAFQWLAAHTGPIQALRIGVDMYMYALMDISTQIQL